MQAYKRQSKQLFLFLEARSNCLTTKDTKDQEYDETCLKRPLKNRQNKGIKDKW